MNILSIVGARPQFVKVAAISRAARALGDIQHRILHTGQHYDYSMSEAFFQEMEIPKPDVHFQIDTSLQGAMTGRMMEKIEQELIHRRPDVVMVYGDTNSTLAGALAAAKLQIPLAHVEAGLRSYNMVMPEEINRICTDKISTYLFCPTPRAVSNLEDEGFRNGIYNIHMVGDVMLDVFNYYRPKKRLPSTLNLSGNPCILASIHRASNVDYPDRLSKIVNAFNELSKDYQLIMPVHPRTKKHLDKMNLPVYFDLIPPQSYFEILGLLDLAEIVITDSGGLQKEAFFMGKPCLTMRDETEWTELVEHGFNILVVPDFKELQTSINAFKKKPSQDFEVPLYGDGSASEQILNVLKNII